MPEEPHKMLLRRADIIAWTGITLDEYEKLLKQGVLNGKPLHPGGRPYFYKEHVRSVLITPFEETTTR